MKASLRYASVLCSLLVSFAAAQSPPFDINAYRTFLQQNQNLTAAQLQSMYSAGTFTRDLQTTLNGIPYLDSIDIKYNLTTYEKQLLRRHNFFVTERLKQESFGKALYDVYKKDLPVFVSTDAILHAIHMSYDKILMDVEWEFLIPKLDVLLAQLHAQLPALDARYGSVPGMQASLKDLDVYLTIPRKLLETPSPISPFYPQNVLKIDTLMRFIAAENGFVRYPLFSSTERLLDFSQFKPRGHYVGPTVDPLYAKYFRAMIWLGRMEIHLIAPQSGPPNPIPTDIQRQLIDAVLVSEAMHSAAALSLLDEMDSIIRFFVGESDNVTLPNLRTVIQAVSLDSASQLLDTQRFWKFQDTLRTKSFAFQRIMSQLLRGDPTEVDSITPASAFLLLGQRFIVDSYVTGNVVYDRIVYQGGRVKRMLPSTLDPLFALGNNATAQLLQQQLDQYHYAPNLAGLRYLIDSYGDDFWQLSLYNAWLNSIRELNPPRVRDSLPAFMKTAAWWQEKLTTQQASWSQLRHDNLLYAKQSYTGIPICSFPESYVEPIPKFYAAIKTFAELGRQRFLQPPFNNQWIAEYFTHVKVTMDTLGEISRKELANVSLTTGERDYLKRMLHTIPVGGCSPDSTFDGWYARLYYQPIEWTLRGIKDVDIVVADVHTAPADEGGAIFGWVLHGGTGYLNMGVWIANKPGAGAHAYVGPVMSYYEHVTTNFQRFTDQEWLTAHRLPPSFRPSYVNLYLADSTGNSRGSGINLLTSVGGGGTASNYPEAPVLHQNYPNPFNPTTYIAFSIPSSYANFSVELTIYDVQGERIQTLVNNIVPAGNFVSRWDGRNEKGIEVASGVYYSRLKVGDFVATKKLMMIR